MHRSLTIAMLLLAMMIVARASGAGAKPLVGVYYFPGWYRAAQNPAGESSEWRTAIMKAAVPRASCGFYNDADPRLWSYYIPWMTTHGLDFIAFDWYYNAGQEFLYESLDRGFLQSKQANDVRFCVHWCNHGGSWWLRPLDQSKRAVLEMTDLLCSRYFHRPNYLRVDGRPVFMIYDIGQLMSFGGEDALRESLKAMRARAQEKGAGDLYLVAVYSGSSPAYIAMLKSLGFDAFCAYTYCWMRPPSIAWDTQAVPYPELAALMAECHYPTLARSGAKVGLPYWPTTFSGWDDRPRAGVERAFINTDNNPADFAKMLKGAMKNTNPESPVVLVEAWNEWGEGACVEPSKEFGFGFLEAIAEVVGKKSPDKRLPTAEEIVSWSVLTPDELKIAQENESKPWPSKTPKLNPPGKSFEVPDVRMPCVLDLAEGGVSTEEISLADMSMEKRDSAGSWFVTTGGDPQIVLPELKVAMRQIRRIVVEGRLLGGAPEGVGGREMEVFWATGLLPAFTQFASAAAAWPSDGSPTIDVSEVVCWEKMGTPLLRLRIDPCSSVGVRILVRRVVLMGE
ncbi:MAG: glycoside hydrolase family 99-like domain-containing protein [Armatimonadetes bacterium]|nr:glycoside hydrolase family 99-like domain-containing protein [Armatimonadota bacterium]